MPSNKANGLYLYPNNLTKAISILQARRVIIPYRQIMYRQFLSVLHPQTNGKRGMIRANLKKIQAMKSRGREQEKRREAADGLLDLSVNREETPVTLQANQEPSQTSNDDNGT